MSARSARVIIASTRASAALGALSWAIWRVSCVVAAAVLDAIAASADRCAWLTTGTAGAAAGFLLIIIGSTVGSSANPRLAAVDAILVQSEGQ